MVAEARAVAVEEKDDEGDERELQERVADVHGRTEDGAHDGFQGLLQGVPEGVGIENGDELLVKPVAHHRDFGDPGGKLKARGDPGAKKLHGLRDLLRGGDEQALSPEAARCLEADRRAEDVYAAVTRCSPPLGRRTLFV